MALSKPVRRPWDERALVQAVEELKSGRISYRQASAKYGIPKSTLNDYVTGKVRIGCRPGPQPVLTRDEEKCLVEWAEKMATIGYGQTRQQICEMVKKIIEKDICRAPAGALQISLRKASALEMPQASACTEERLYSGGTSTLSNSYSHMTWTVDLITYGTVMRVASHYPPNQVRCWHPVVLELSIVHAVLRRIRLLHSWQLVQVGG